MSLCFVFSYTYVDKWQIKLFTIHWLELWLLKGTLKQEMLNFGWTLDLSDEHVILKVDIFVSELSLTVCQLQRIGRGRCGKRNQFWRTRRSKEHRQKKKRGDELSFPSTDRKSHFLTKKSPHLSVCVIHIRDGIIHLCSPFLIARSWINSMFTLILKGNTEPGMTFDMSMNTEDLIETVFALLSKTMDHHGWETWD